MPRPLSCDCIHSGGIQERAGEGNTHSGCALEYVCFCSLLLPGVSVLPPGKEGSFAKAKQEKTEISVSGAPDLISPYLLLSWGPERACDLPKGTQHLVAKLRSTPIPSNLLLASPEL